MPGLRQTFAIIYRMSTTRKVIILFFAIVVLVVPIFIVAKLIHPPAPSDPQKLFYAAMNKNLSDKAATCEVRKSESGTEQDIKVALDLASKVNAHSTMRIKNVNSTVQTEEVVLKSGDYLRYTQATTTAKNSQGKQPDLSPLIGKWIKADAKKPTELFGLTALGGCVVPLADVPTANKL
jgi:hypothetical protein